VLLVYDVTNPESYKHLELWQERFYEATVAEDLPFIVIGAKADRPIRVSGDLVEKEWIEPDRADKHFTLSAKEP